MNKPLPYQWAITAAICLYVVAPIASPATVPTDPLSRENPRSAVTSFLEACRSHDYQKAAQYLDLRQQSDDYRANSGPELARQLETILNSDSHFSVLHLSPNPGGDPAIGSDPNREQVLTISQDGQNLTLDLERVILQNGGPHVWLFAADTVDAIPKIHVSTISATVARYLPPVLVSQEFLGTGLWKWIVLVLLALLMISLSRLLDWMIALLVTVPAKRLTGQSNGPWVAAVIQPLRVILCLAVFRIGVGIIDPSALARLYIGRGIALVFVWSITWCLVRLVWLLMNHFESKLDTAHQLASRTMLRLGRRAATTTIIVVAILMVLQSWGYNTSTLIAGLGVGGIAIALAAQQTIANVFGGVSLIGDQPIRIGEFGKFGDMKGVVEDIGMRSTRIRTLDRTVVSVPNSNFAGLNLENFSVRDKILFNPTFQIKRSTTDEQLQALIKDLDNLFSSRHDLEPVSTPARLTALTSGSYSLELFCYVLTVDINDFYKIQTGLLLSINQLLNHSHIDLA